MVPHPDALRIERQAFDQPIAGSEEPVAPELWIVPLPVLGDGNGVVLRADLAAVVEQRDAGLVEGTGVIGLPRKRHVVLAQLIVAGPRVGFRMFVPERQLAVPPENVGANNALVIGETFHKAIEVARWLGI